MQKVIILGLLVVVLLSACTASPSDEQVSSEEQTPLITLYRSPT
jgi:uncharacterized lipoprotein